MRLHLKELLINSFRTLKFQSLNESNGVTDQTQNLKQFVNITRPKGPL